MRSAVALALVLLACRDDARAPSWGDHPVPTLAAAAPSTPAPPPPAPAAPDERAAFIRTHYTKHEYRVPMRDGVRLLTQVFVPNDAGPAKRYPFLITRTPYTVAPYGPDRYPGGLGPIAAIEQAGYIFVRQDVRGKGLSEGEFVDMRPHRANKRGTEFDESSDAHDTVAWLLAHVADHNGKAGIWGISYPGFYAAAAAIDAHPALVAVSPQAPCLDWWQGDDMHRHGAFALQEAFTFFYGFGHARPAPDDIERDDAWPSVPWGTPDPYAYFLRLPPLASLDDAAFGGAVPQIWKDFIAHPDYDEFWTARSHARTREAWVGPSHSADIPESIAIAPHAVCSAHTRVRPPWRSARYRSREPRSIRPRAILLSSPEAASLRTCWTVTPRRRAASTVVTNSTTSAIQIMFHCALNL